jgi:site-specific DNA recombinase
MVAKHPAAQRPAEVAKPVGIWIRVSTEDQAQGDSPEHHEKRARFYAESKGWVVQEVYHLEAVSGKAVLQHAEAQRMLKDVKRGRISGLIFSKLARLARNTKELLEIADVFQNLGVDLISLQESIDTSTPAGRLFYTMIAAMAQWEREEIGERIKASVAIRAKLQKPINGKLPYGYHWVDGKMALHPQEAPIRRLVYELYDELHRKKAVARVLNDKGFRTRDGKLFSDSTIDTLLTDPAAKGTHRANWTQRVTTGGKFRIEKPKDQWVWTPVEPIVPEELWERCNRHLAERAAKRAKKMQLGRTPKHLFSGLVVCSCGTKMYVRYNSPNKYICQSCRNKIPIDDLEAVFLEQLKGFFLSPAEVADKLGQADEHLQGREQLLSTLEAEHGKIKQEIERIYKLYTDGQIDGDGFGRFYKPLQQRQTQLDEELPRLQAEVDLLKVNHLSADKILSEAQDLYTRWPHLNQEEKRKVVDSITEKITIGKDGIDIDLCHLPTPLSEDVTKWQSRLLAARATTKPPPAARRTPVACPQASESYRGHASRRGQCA